jgi:hypothetical protein
MPKGKPYSGSIDRKTAQQLLNSSGELFEGAPLGDALMETSRRLADLVVQANQFLKTNEFAGMVADYHAIKLGRRGRAELLVTGVGAVVLEIGYDDDDASPRQLVKATRRKLPLLKNLRTEAQKLGVSIEHLGIKRKEIVEFLERCKSERKGSERRAPPVGDLDPGPMGAGPDEVRVVPGDEPRPPKRRSLVKTGESVEVSSLVIDNDSTSSTLPGSASRRSMRQMVEQSREVDIADLLDSKPPD